jgi:L-2-hydroxycarboxylate dehydrogenase (NAD+)
MRLMPEEILALAEQALIRNDVPQRQAEIVSKATLAAELRGISSHGLQMLPVYIRRVRGGGIIPNVQPEIHKVSDGLYKIDAKGGFGQVAAQAATELMIEQLRYNNPVVVTIHNTNHCGMLAYYTRQVAKHYALGFMAANTNPNVPAFGGAEKVLGTNPFSVAVPWKDDCILIDMATTSIAKGKIYQYEESGKTLPQGCAIDKNGNPTTDPRQAINGMLLPFAGHKGYAISIAVELLAGLVSGAGYSKHTYSLHSAVDKQQNLGVYMQAIPLKPLLDKESYEKRMEDFTSIIKESKKAPGTESIFLPGEMEQEIEKSCLMNGIEVRIALINEIKQL